MTSEENECCGKCYNKYAALNYENPNQCVDPACACHKPAPSDSAHPEPPKPRRWVLHLFDNGNLVAEEFCYHTDDPTRCAMWTTPQGMPRVNHVPVLAEADVQPQLDRLRAERDRAKDREMETLRLASERIKRVEAENARLMENAITLLNRIVDRRFCFCHRRL